MVNKLVSIIIVNWNGGAVFKDCLESLAKINYPHWELIIVDNGSIDGSDTLPLKLKIRNEKVKIIKNKTNFGFARANNQGYAVARGEYILLLNNDTRVTPLFLSVLVKKMEEESDLGVVQPKIFLMDKPGYLDNAGSFLTKLGFTQHWGFMEEDGPEFGSERFIFSAKGACMLIRGEIIKKVGLFDEEFVSYFEESDFCFRVWLAGWKVLYYPDAEIYHKVGFTSKKIDQTTVYYHSIKNRILSFYKNLETVNLLLILIPHTLLICGIGVYYLLRVQLGKAKMVFSAILWNIAHFPQAREKRRKTQALRIKRDEEIFRFIMHKTDMGDLLAHFRKVEANF